MKLGLYLAGSRRCNLLYFHATFFGAEGSTDQACCTGTEKE